MVLHPIGLPPETGGIQSAWSAVERRQRAWAAEWWLISQPDHAALAGALAANFISLDFPALDPLLARAIEVHDAGWALFEPEAGAAAPPLDSRGKPLSFLEIAPPDFLRAWTASIDRAEQACPAGGYIVSRHFSSLADARLTAGLDRPENTARLATFLDRESARQQRLRKQAGPSREELEALVAVLQFCDLLSLFLCCGASEPVEFPQCFSGGRVRLFPRDGGFALAPSPFRHDSSPARSGISLGVQARRYPPSSCAANATTLAFLLW